MIGRAIRFLLSRLTPREPSPPELRRDRIDPYSLRERELADWASEAFKCLEILDRSSHLGQPDLDGQEIERIDAALAFWRSWAGRPAESGHSRPGPEDETPRDGAPRGGPKAA